MLGPDPGPTTATDPDAVTVPALTVDLVGWHRALTAYRTLDFAAAEQEFRAAASRGDNAARMMAERSARLAASPPGPDWDGVYEQHSK